MADLSTTINGFLLSTLVCNASGVMCTTKDQLSVLANDDRIGAIFTKSCTLERRNGNPSPRYYATGGTSINSMGLPNEGLQYYLDVAAGLSHHKKPMFISVAGLTMDENVQMMKMIDDESDTVSGAAGAELNLSCPNVPGKPQIGYDFDATSELLRRVDEATGGTLQFGIKLPPYFDPIHFEMANEAISPFTKTSIRWVTCINSIGNGLVVDPITETTVIAPKRGLGGIGGQAIKATALANVHTFRTLLPDHVDIIGCGGITRGMDVFEHVLCGAAAVQIGTLLQDHSLVAVGSVISELRDIMKIKGYRKLADFRGQLKVATSEEQLRLNDPAKHI